MAGLADSYSENDDPALKRKSLLANMGEPGTYAYTGPGNTDQTMAPSPGPTTAGPLPPSAVSPNPITEPNPRVGLPGGPEGGLTGGTLTPITPPTSNGRTDEAAIRAQIAQWAAMPGADPSLANNPDYWVQAITSRGGLGPDNLSYWQNASVGPTAFFNNPGREGGGNPAPGGNTQPGPAQNPGTPQQILDFYAAQTSQIQAQQARDAAVQQTMRDSLLRLMNQGSEPVGDLSQDPGVVNYNVARRRGANQDREAVAERAAFLGLNPGGQGSGSFESQIQGLNENASQDIAGYQANRSIQELQSRRDMLVQGLQIANALGARTEADSLQRELAMIDTQMKQQQFGLDYAQLGQQQGQFEDSTGFNYASLLANLNRDSYLNLMQ